MKLSIITITYNNLSGLQKTFNSLFHWLTLNQASLCFEWIVIDGGSNDGSLEFIKKNHAVWLEERKTSRNSR